MSYIADHTYIPGRDYAVITCPKCNRQVRYSPHADTRPKYCPDCEKSEIAKYAGSDYWKQIRLHAKNLGDDPEQAVLDAIEEEMRVPIEHAKHTEQVKL